MKRWKTVMYFSKSKYTSFRQCPKILYYMNRGIKTNARSEYPEIWDLMSIKYILSQTAYAGHTVNFQTAVKSYKTKKQIRLPKEDCKILRGRR